jgi:hypothetical protein
VTGSPVTSILVADLQGGWWVPGFGLGEAFDRYIILKLKFYRGNLDEYRKKILLQELALWDTAFGALLGPLAQSLCMMAAKPEAIALRPEHPVVEHSAEMRLLIAVQKLALSHAAQWDMEDRGAELQQEWTNLGDAPSGNGSVLGEAGRLYFELRQSNLRRIDLRKQIDGCVFGAGSGQNFRSHPTVEPT